VVLDFVAIAHAAIILFTEYKQPHVFAGCVYESASRNHIDSQLHWKDAARLQRQCDTSSRIRLDKNIYDEGLVAHHERLELLGPGRYACDTKSTLFVSHAAARGSNYDDGGKWHWELALTLENLSRDHPGTH
jgi:hypothetical protein